MAIDLVKRTWGERALRVGVLGCGFCVGWTKPAASDKSIALRDGRQFHHWPTPGSRNGLFRFQTTMNDEAISKVHHHPGCAVSACFLVQLLAGAAAGSAAATRFEKGCALHGI